jgi:hypothetical protein
MPASSSFSSSRLHAAPRLPTLGVVRLLLLFLLLLCFGGALELPLNAEEASAIAADAAASSSSSSTSEAASSAADPTRARRRHLDEEVSNDGASPPAAASAATTTTATAASAAASASLMSAQLYQPKLLVVEGQPAHHGLASISNPCTFSNRTNRVDKDDIFVLLLNISAHGLPLSSCPFSHWLVVSSVGAFFC